MLTFLTDSLFWIALLKIVWVDILLSGDNAIVIALATRNLPARQQKQAIFWGSAAAVMLRVTLTFFAIQLLQWPYLKVLGALLLIWIGIGLLQPEDDEKTLHAHDYLFAAIRTILMADLVMSLDNVIAVAASADSGPAGAKLGLLIIGLGLSIPLIVTGSTLLLKLMTRFPIIITGGAAMLGFVAGEMMVTDPAVTDWFDHSLDYTISLTGALCVVGLGLWMANKKKRSLRQPSQ